MSLALGLALLWVAVVLLWGWQARPRKVRNLVVQLPATQSAQTQTSQLTPKQMAAGIITATIVTLAIHPMLGIAIAVGLWVIPHRRRMQQQRQHQAAITDELPEAIDLLRLAISSGLNIHQAVAAVGERLHGPVGCGLAEIAQQVNKGRRISEALEPLPKTTGEPVRHLTRVLIDSDRYGTDLEAALAQLAADSRVLRHRRCEELARRLPLRLLGPLVFCILPAFVLLTLTPALAETIAVLRDEL